MLNGYRGSQKSTYQQGNIFSTAFDNNAAGQNGGAEDHNVQFAYEIDPDKAKFISQNMKLEYI